MRISERTLLTCSQPALYESHRKQALKAFRGRGSKRNITQHTFPNRTRSLEQRGALFGLTFCIKDNILIRGAPCSFGLSPALIQGSHLTSPAVAWLEDCGASLIASTNLDPCALNYTGTNEYLGDVPNALFSDLICGGSSSGAAHAVAAKFCDFAIGTDSGGSIRIPAAANGICGFRPSSNLLPRGGILLLSEKMDGPGFLTKTPADMCDLLVALGLSLQNTSQLNSLCVPHDDELDILSPDSRAEFCKRVDTVSKKLNLPVSSLAPVFLESVEIRQKLFAKEASSFLKQYLLEGLGQEKTALGICEYAKSLSPETLTQAAQSKEELKARLAPLSENSLLLTPLLPRDLPAIGDTTARPPLHYYLCLANLLDLPSVSLCSRTGDPNSGIQIVLPPASDHLVAGRLAQISNSLMDL